MQPRGSSQCHRLASMNVGFPCRYNDRLDWREAQIQSVETNLNRKEERLLRLVDLVKQELHRTTSQGGGDADDLLVEAEHQIQPPLSSRGNASSETPEDPREPAAARELQDAEMDVETRGGRCARRAVGRPRRVPVPVEVPRAERKRTSRVLDDGTTRSEGSLSETPKKVRFQRSCHCQFMSSAVPQKRSNTLKEEETLGWNDRTRSLRPERRRRQHP